MSNRSAVVIFFLCLVAIPLAFSVYSLIGKKVIEHRMEERMEVENLQVITIDAASVIWLKANKELLIDGEPFDVRTIKKDGSKLILSGLFDAPENELKNKLEVYHNSKDKPVSSNTSLLLFVFTNYCQINEPLNLSTPFFIHKKKAWQIYQDNACTIQHEINTPPPKSLLASISVYPAKIPG